MECEIREAQEEDAADVSCVIIGALRSTSAQAYSQEIIDRVEKSFSPSAVSELIGRRTAFVALMNGKIVGTASLDGKVVRTVFVAPGSQGQGIGRSLMNAVDCAAREAGAGVEVLSVPLSVNAETFYSELGFIPVRDSYHGDERTVVMERRLV